MNNSTPTLVDILTGEKAVRREHQLDVPDSDGSKPNDYQFVHDSVHHEYFSHYQC